MSIIVPLDRFNTQNLKLLQSDLKINGFSQEALNAWHKFTPKMAIQGIIDLLSQAGFADIVIKKHLNSMAVAVSTIKK